MATNNYGLTEEEMQELEEFAKLIGEPLLVTSRQRFTSQTNVRTISNRVEQERAMEEEIKRVSGLEEVYEPRSRRYTSSAAMTRKTRPEAKKTAPERKEEGTKTKTVEPAENKVVPMQKRNISHVAGNIENIYEYQMYSDDPIVTMDYDPSKKSKVKKPKTTEKSKAVEKTKNAKIVVKAEKTQVNEQPLEGEIQNISEYEELTGDKIIDMDYATNRSRRKKIITKAEKVEIKRAKGQVKDEQKRRNKKRSIWERIYNLKEYTNGVSDLYYETLDNMPEEEQVGFWKDEIERLEDTRKDYASINRKLMPLKLGIASIGLIFSMGLGYSIVNSTMDTINAMHSPKEVQQPTTIVTQLSGNKLIYEENLAKKSALVSKDQEYLLERINSNFIPENVSEEEMRELMEEAWEKLEPEIQKWVREPDKVYETKLKQQKSESDKSQTTQESTADNTKEDMQR